MSTWEVIHGDCLEVLRGMPDASVDSTVCDPPYGLSFMGKRWDYDVPSVEVWAECLRVLKPGGHLLAFAGTRTQHRMAVRIEDAGFEIRDMIAWVYGSGFPKSKNVALSIDKAEGHPNRGRAIPTASTFQACDREQENKLTSNSVPPYQAKTDLARPWSGWGTALKPALEPITMARKPFASTVAANVQQWGTGAINVDGCRVGTEAVTINTWDDGAKPFGGGSGHAYTGRIMSGRWPANLIHDGSDEVVGVFPEAGGSKPGSFQREKTSRGLKGGGFGQERSDMRERTELTKPGYEDSGSAARFFYCAKASKADRDDGLDTSSTHPTVKPTELMRYLCRLVTPPGGTVLDPFTGSGSTGRGALAEGFNFIGIEREAEYVEIARRRIAEAANNLYVGAK